MAERLLTHLSLPHRGCYADFSRAQCMEANCRWEIPDEASVFDYHYCTVNVTCTDYTSAVSCESHAPQCAWGPPNAEDDPPALPAEVFSVPQCMPVPDGVVVSKCSDVTSRDDCTPEASGCYWSKGAEGCYSYYHCNDFATPEECAASKRVPCQWGAPKPSPSPSPASSEAGHCEGSADSCSGSSSSSCEKVKGCSYTPHRKPCSGGFGCFETVYSCDGSPTSCNLMTSSTSCLHQGCRWVAEDARTEGTGAANSLASPPPPTDGSPTPNTGLPSPLSSGSTGRDRPALGSRGTWFTKLLVLLVPAALLLLLA
jgi:hypothetical protein